MQQYHAKTKQCVHIYVIQVILINLNLINFINDDDVDNDNDHDDTHFNVYQIDCVGLCVIHVPLLNLVDFIMSRN